MATKAQIDKLKKVVKSANRRAEIANAAFNKLSPSEKRVQIARDVLAQLASKRLIATPGFWLTAANGGGLFSEKDVAADAELQDLLKQTKTCEGCALGGMFMCAVERADKLKVSTLENESCDGQPSESDTFTYLKRFFSLDQLHLIEFTFEMGNGASNIESPDLRDAAISFFGETYEVEEDAELRMRLIMENIVANKGRFVVTKKPVKVWATPGFYV